MSASPRKLSLPNLASSAGAIVLVGSQTIASAFVTGWAFAGLFHLPTTVAWVIEAVLVCVALYATYWFARQAMRADPPFVSGSKS